MKTEKEDFFFEDDQREKIRHDIAVMLATNINDVVQRVLYTRADSYVADCADIAKEFAEVVVSVLDIYDPGE